MTKKEKSRNIWEETIELRYHMETKIQELRKANKISQAELADEMGVTRQTII